MHVSIYNLRNSDGSVVFPEPSPLPPRAASPGNAGLLLEIETFHGIFTSTTTSFTGGEGATERYSSTPVSIFLRKKQTNDTVWQYGQHRCISVYNDRSGDRLLSVSVVADVRLCASAVIGTRVRARVGGEIRVTAERALVEEKQENPGSGTEAAWKRGWERDRCDLSGKSVWDKG